MGFLTSTFTHTQTTLLTLPQSPPSRGARTHQPTLGARYKTAVSLLHEPGTITLLNPLVTDYKEIDSTSADLKPLLPLIQSSPQAPLSQLTKSQRKFFRITDSKPVLGSWYSAQFDYYFSYLKVDNGCDTVVAAPGGVSIVGSWRVSRNVVPGGGAKAEELRLVEKATVTCPSVFAPFIKGALGSSHEEMHGRFVDKWRDRLGIRASDGGVR